MKPTFSNPMELAEYYSFVVKTKKDAERLCKAWSMYSMDYKGDGCMGCVAEMLTATKNSVKDTVSNAGKADCYIRYRTANGSVIPVSCERKTNGGRVSTIQTEFSKAEKMVGKFVVYSLDLCNSTTCNKRRYVPAVVIPKTLFLNKLTEFGALRELTRSIKDKETNEIIGKYTDGIGIQANNKEWFLWLSDYPIVYDRDAIYCDDDFEGLE